MAITSRMQSHHLREGERGGRPHLIAVHVGSCMGVDRLGDRRACMTEAARDGGDRPAVLQQVRRVGVPQVVNVEWRQEFVWRCRWLAVRLGEIAVILARKAICGPLDVFQRVQDVVRV
jgi:hypothetical protein